MVQGVGLVQIHTAFYQFCVLWAFPLLVSAPFVIGILKNIKTFSDKRIKNFFINVEYPDLYGVVLILCAVGLIFIPEFFYVRDIYEKTAPRANTMFKLTYQAYIWLNKNVKGQPVVLEACGDSYQNYDNRVSAMTGLPTVLGWYVHEWL